MTRLGPWSRVRLEQSPQVIGRLGEVACKRRMMLASLAAFAVGTLVCAIAGNLAELVAGRVIQGAAATCAGAFIACATRARVPANPQSRRGS